MVHSGIITQVYLCLTQMIKNHRPAEHKDIIDIDKHTSDLASDYQSKNDPLKNQIKKFNIYIYIQ